MYLINEGEFAFASERGASPWTSYAIFDANPTDGAAPALEGNTLTAGQAGGGGAIGGQPGEQGETNS